MSENIVQENIFHKLLKYISENNPDLLVQLEENGELTNYLSEKVKSISSILNKGNQASYIIEQTCMDALTQDLRPSRYNYICKILEEEFPATYRQLHETGILKFEAINLIEYCHQVFEAMHFSEANEDNMLLHYAIAGSIGEYFDKAISENETVSNGLQQSTEVTG